MLPRNNCSGCGACASVCPVNCILMKENSEGFTYPEINLDQCVSCGLCEKSCQILFPIKKNGYPTAYACYNNNKRIQKKSSSGGVFTLIAEWIISKGGVVFGAAFDKDLKVHHICVNSKRELKLLRGSKYVQSVIGNTYYSVREHLNNDEYVLFTGTPCQIDGLLHFLAKDYDKLYTQDIICHGVPSYKFWHKYLYTLAQQFNTKLNEKKLPSFRDKSISWQSFSMKVPFENNKTYVNYHRNDLFMRAFLKNYSLRHSCYSCCSKSICKNSDITLGDFWGIENVCPEMVDNNGVSLVLVNSHKGKILFDGINERMTYKEVNVSDALSQNPPAYESPIIPERRKYFYALMDNHNLFELCDYEQKDLLYTDKRHSSIWKRINIAQIKLRSFLKKLAKKLAS